VADLQAMLDAEAALAGASAEVGLVPQAAADEIAQACRADLYDAGALAAEAAAAGNPAIPLVRALAARLSPAAAAHVHRGATSQDIIDTAASLVARRLLPGVVADLRRAADRSAALAREHRTTPMAGRTLLQQAVPTTFGLKAAGWMTALDASAAALATLGERLPAQLGGAAGTLSALGDDGPAVVAAFARRLGLAAPVLPWHTDRTGPASLAAALGVAAGACGKVGLDVVLLVQTEVGEAHEAGEGRGGSSTMPHKHNPVAAVAAIAAARRAPGLVATMLACMGHEHERAAGSWQAEWDTAPALLAVAAAGAAAIAESLERLVVDPARMRANLALQGDLPLAEAATTQLTPAMGRADAHALVEEACRRAVAEGASLAETLWAGGHDVDLAPERYLGTAPALVDAALRARSSVTTADAR
jgi:3-carboxy-cis,cis-muconate cycloisomerase